MKVLFARLWKDQDGFLLSAEAILYATILVIGSLVGMNAVREAVVTELADVAQAIANLDQSYSFGAAAGHCAFTAGASFADAVDFCDTTSASAAVQNSKCVVVCGSGNGFVALPTGSESGT